MPDRSCMDEVEAERRRLAQLLDDHLIRSLNLLVSQANAYKMTMNAAPQVQMAFSMLSSLSLQALQQALDLKDALNPGILETLGLEPALETLATQFTRRTGLAIDLSIRRLAQRPSYAAELMLFRMVQQLLDHAFAHHANRASIQLQDITEALTLTYRDNSQVSDRHVLELIVAPLKQHGAQVTMKTEPSDGLELQINLRVLHVAGLTSRELDVLQLVAEGMSNKEIAAALHITPRTVSFHLDNVYSKCAVSTRTEAVVVAVRRGWLSLPD